MDLVAEAKERIENLTPADVAAELQAPGVVLLDLREREEIEADGAIPGAIHAPRGMLEFFADPSTPYHIDRLDPARRTILYCSWGGRSALACASLTELGYQDVGHLDGGFKAWARAGYAVEQPDEGTRSTQRRPLSRLDRQEGESDG